MLILLSENLMYIHFYLFIYASDATMSWPSDATLELTNQRREVMKVIVSRSDIKSTYNAFNRQIRASSAMDYEQCM